LHDCCVHQIKIQNPPKHSIKTQTKDNFLERQHIAGADLKIKLLDIFKAFAKESTHLGCIRKHITKPLKPLMRCTGDIASDQPAKKTPKPPLEKKQRRTRESSPVEDIELGIGGSGGRS
jgi:hypothetical protein